MKDMKLFNALVGSNLLEGKITYMGTTYCNGDPEVSYFHDQNGRWITVYKKHRHTELEYNCNINHPEYAQSDFEAYAYKMKKVKHPLKVLLMPRNRARGYYCASVDGYVL